MRYYTINLDGEDINFRITSADSLEIEKKVGKSLQDYIQTISNTSCVNLLKYMRKSSVPNFSEKDANDLYDKLVDNGYSLQSIYMEIIFPACVESGLLTKSDLQKLHEAMDEAETPKKATQE